jgi:FixJ family two-component response regulator
MIYIIDDDAYVRRGFQLLLESAGYEFDAYESGIDFLKRCEPVETDMLLLDLHMPDMNGCELLNTLMKKKIRMHVIVVTAYDTPLARDCAREYGVVAFLRKPVDGDALLDLVNFIYRAPKEIF